MHGRWITNQVPFVFRSATNEILYMSHLDTVNARWSYDIMWAAGLFSTYDLFFAAIDEKTREVKRSRACAAREMALGVPLQLHRSRAQDPAISSPASPPARYFHAMPQGYPCSVLKCVR